MRQLMSRQIEVSDPWFTYLLQGTKTVEGRKASPKWVDLIVGQKIWFEDSATNRIGLFTITRITTYDSLEQYLVCEGLRQTLPGKTTLQEGVAVYMEWNTVEELARYKFLGIEVKLIPKAEEMIRVLGALALDLSISWTGTGTRLNLIKELSSQLGRDYLVAWLEEHYESLCYDASLLKNWKGPYCKCTRANLSSLGIMPDTFFSPHQCIEDYDPKEDPLVEATLNVIGALARSIRYDYFYIKTRSELIKELAQKIGRHDLVAWLDKKYEKVSKDGRIIQGWPGPYHKCSPDDLKMLELTLDIFASTAADCVAI